MEPTRALPELNLDARTEAYKPSPEDFELAPAIVPGDGWMCTVTLPDRDSSENGMTQCAHCLLVPKGIVATHHVLAVANPDLKPQRAWFMVPQLKMIAAQDFPTQGIRLNWRNWTVNPEMTFARLFVEETGERYVWKLTELTAGDLRLGVWAD